ncbi:MAG: DUF962 domain-containing protein [Burkholderiaceae bacterium]|jgi:uncharacterized membrane protein YGL010W|nr:DUF962 domain-containing protein [Aquabacterium sp.]NUP86368.1 DUF962 domain-containing protein [Burkholderiaceae bacterium]
MPSRLFRPASELLVQYARYHRDRRNIAMHAIGIPLVLFSMGVLSARIGVAGMSLAWLLWAVTSLWYLTRGTPLLGAAVCALNAALMALAHPPAMASVGGWLAWGMGTLVAGWLFQFLGHYYEGRKPGLRDDIADLMVGPMYAVAQWLFSLGWRRELHAEIERRAGPTHLRDLAAPIAH